MRTDKQIDASRLNGAKSRGPVTAEGKNISAANAAHSTGPRTPEGKARSARNGLKHQKHRVFLANAVTLPVEKRVEFLNNLRQFRLTFLPVGFLEERIVENIAVYDWYRRRNWTIGNVKIAHATIEKETSADFRTQELNVELGGALHTALAVSDLADNGRALEYLRRSDTAYAREYCRARQELFKLQAERRGRREAEPTNPAVEPNPPMA